MVEDVLFVQRQSMFAGTEQKRKEKKNGGVKKPVEIGPRMMQTFECVRVCMVLACIGMHAALTADALEEYNVY